MWTAIQCDELLTFQFERDGQDSAVRAVEIIQQRSRRQRWPDSPMSTGGSVFAWKIDRLGGRPWMVVVVAAGASC